MNPPPLEAADPVASFYRPTWIEISKEAFASNIRQLKSIAGPRTGFIAVLKADGYGHGAGPLAKIAVDNGADMIGVSSLEEGITLRSADITAPILIMGSIFPLENFEVAVQNNLTPTVASLESAKKLLDVAKKKNGKISFHLKVDTGMGRIGVSPIGTKSLLAWLRDQPQLDLAGVYSHLAASDSDPSMTQDQLTQFLNVREIATGLGFTKTKFHLANSAAAIRYPETRLDMVRPGLSLYGVANVPLPADVHLTPVMSWHSRIVFLKKVPAGTSISYGATFRAARESEIATLPVGYADGVPRRVSNRGEVLIKGKRCPIVGRVTMDQIMVDVTGINADIGEYAVLMGKQDQAAITAMDWAGWAETIPYEIFCGISKRVPRVMAS